MVYYIDHQHILAVLAVTTNSMILIFLVLGTKLILSVEGIKVHSKLPKIMNDAFIDL